MDFTEVEKEEQQELSEIPFKADNNIFNITILASGARYASS